MSAGLFEKTSSRDERMIAISGSANIANFVSFDGSGRLRFARLGTRSLRNSSQVPLKDLLENLLSSVGRVNLRFFAPGASTGARMVPDVSDLKTLFMTSEQCIAEDGYVIVSEAIALDDGGISGVVVHDVVEFMNGVTPRFVDQSTSKFPQLPTSVGEKMLRAIYGNDVNLLLFDKELRVEFSVHPNPVGHLGRRMIVWDAYHAPASSALRPMIEWPNVYSDWLGDKLYGLLVADAVGLTVPKSVGWLHPRIESEHESVFERWTPSLGVRFGQDTGSTDEWLRSSPSRRDPGKYPTLKSSSKMDPLDWMAQIDPNGRNIRSVVQQQNVRSVYSGAAECGQGATLIEGVAGSGESYMLGRRVPEHIPKPVERNVRLMADQIFAAFGASRFEWAFDGDQTWLLQVNQKFVEDRSPIEVEVEGKKYVDFDPTEGLERLAEVIIVAKEADATVRLGRRVGLTSHVCELLHRADVKYALARQVYSR